MPRLCVTVYQLPVQHSSLSRFQTSVPVQFWSIRAFFPAQLYRSGVWETPTREESSPDVVLTERGCHPYFDITPSPGTRIHSKESNIFLNYLSSETFPCPENYLQIIYRGQFSAQWVTFNKSYCVTSELSCPDETVVPIRSTPYIHMGYCWEQSEDHSWAAVYGSGTLPSVCIYPILLTCINSIKEHWASWNMLAHQPCCTPPELISTWTLTVVYFLNLQIDIPTFSGVRKMSCNQFGQQTHL